MNSITVTGVVEYVSVCRFNTLNSNPLFHVKQEDNTTVVVYTKQLYEGIKLYQHVSVTGMPMCNWKTGSRNYMEFERVVIHAS